MGHPTATDDYYEILQLSPKADQETIGRVYRSLAKRYHPDNKHTGDDHKFNLLTEAYRALSDPEKRAAYDAQYESANARDWALLFRTTPSEGADEDRRIYQAVLSILYTTRRRDANSAAVGVAHLEKMLGVPEKHLEFHIWYLKEKKWIERNEDGGFVITAIGVDEVIKDDLLLQKNRLLPFSKDFTTDFDSYIEKLTRIPDYAKTQ
jgi:curved DNA-binding protein CbpA